MLLYAAAVFSFLSVLWSEPPLSMLLFCFFNYTVIVIILIALDLSILLCSQFNMSSKRIEKLVPKRQKVVLPLKVKNWNARSITPWWVVCIHITFFQCFNQCITLKIIVEARRRYPDNFTTLITDGGYKIEQVLQLPWLNWWNCRIKLSYLKVESPLLVLKTPKDSYTVALVQHIWKLCNKATKGLDVFKKSKQGQLASILVCE